MDGNRRWAKERGLPSVEGHQAGYEKLKEVVSWGKELGVSNLIFYTFSTENWRRSEEEISYLMRILKTALQNELNELSKENVRVRFMGELERFSPDLQELFVKTEAQTSMNTGGTVVFALSYGGRAEILSGIQKALSSGKASVTEQEFSDSLWSADIPDPDIIIRTGGEKRLSNFLPWQSIYSELFFSDSKWPDFTKEELETILTEFSQRERRRGA